ncbi:MAG: hypothetical protein AAFO74_16070 [Pseudomonadota bacterium]
MNMSKFAFVAAAMLCLLFAASPLTAQVLPSKNETVTQTRQASPVPGSSRLPDSVQRDIARSAADAKAERCAQLEPELTWNWYPGFDWNMPKRYGNDRALYDDGNGGKTGNGIVDLPNTKAYITNSQSYSNEPSDACRCERQPDGTCEARFRVRLTTANVKSANWRRVASSLREARENNQCPALTFPDRPNPAQFTFFVDGQRLPVDDTNPVDVCLTEGHHPIRLDMSYDDTTRTVVRQIEIIDHLIVNLGDSFGAGEGAPETNFRPQLMEHFAGWGSDNVFKSVDWTKHYIQQVPFFAQWADPGIEIPMTTKKIYAYTEIHEEKAKYDGQEYPLLFTKWDHVKYRADMTMPDWDAIKSRFYDRGQPANDDLKVLMDHHHAHRSSATGASQLALHLDYHDPKSSVTFVNLAASGATIQDGVIGPYRGVYELKSKTNMSAFVPEHNGVPGLRPQISELSDLIGDRKVDHLYLSVGGNDAGFAQVIEVFLTAWNFESDRLDANVQKMLTYLRNGKWDEADWTRMPGTGAIRPSLLSFAWQNANQDSVVGLDGLQAGYQTVNDTLQNLLGRRRFSGDVTLIGYPNFTASTRTDMSPKLNKRTLDDSELYYCDIHVKSGQDPALPVDLDFDPHEFKQAQTHVLGALSSTMRKAVMRINSKNNRDEVPINWSLLDQGQRPAHHGICGYGQYDRFEFAAEYRQYTARNLLNGSFLTNSVADKDGFAWYRTPQQGAATQRGMAITNTGLFHPNEFGYRHVGRRLLQELKFYGAEFTSSDFINADQASLFADPDDSLREASRVRNNVIKGALVGSQDVQMYRIPVSTRRCVPMRVEFKSDASDNQLAIWAFGPNGELVATTSNRSAGIELIGQTTEMKRSQSTSVSFPQSRISPAGIALQRVQPPEHETKFCPAEAHTAYQTTRRTDEGLQLTFLAGHRDDIWIAVSHADNLKFDPVTGRGDNRENLDRDRIDFEGTIRAMN